MRLHPANGIWEIFVPGVTAGARYKYELLDQEGELLPVKTDPFASFHEPPPGNAGIVYESRFEWQDAGWLENGRTPTGSRNAQPCPTLRARSAFTKCI
jgi:1,4-alpha-glucan branching enzyme